MIVILLVYYWQYGPHAYKYAVHEFIHIKINVTSS